MSVKVLGVFPYLKNESGTKLFLKYFGSLTLMSQWPSSVIDRLMRKETTFPTCFTSFIIISVKGDGVHEITGQNNYNEKKSPISWNLINVIHFSKYVTRLFYLNITICLLVAGY